MATTENMLLADITKLSENYFELSQELATIAEKKAFEWLGIRKGCKTNAEADQLWDATEFGRREAYLKIYLKGLEKLRGARILEFKANSGNNSW